jgi:hypothetical protein
LSLKAPFAEPVDALEGHRLIVPFADPLVGRLESAGRRVGRPARGSPLKAPFAEPVDALEGHRQLRRSLIRSRVAH